MIEVSQEYIDSEKMTCDIALSKARTMTGENFYNPKVEQIGSYTIEE